MPSRVSSISLRWRILLSTSVAITALLALTGWIVQAHAVRLTAITIESEVTSSLRAYESLWHSRADTLRAVSLVLSRMPDVRAAFNTGDPATIRDTAAEIWSRLSDEGGLFVVADPNGGVIASNDALVRGLPVVRAAAARFPEQSAGFMMMDGRLYQIAVTPVYIESSAGPALINVLVAGYTVDADLAEALKQATGGSDFVFSAGGRVVASSAPPAPPGAVSELAVPLADVEGKPVGELRIRRGFDAARLHIATLRRDILLIWAGAVLAALLLTWILAGRILRPIEELDRAAGRIAHGDYSSDVRVSGQDELGRLAESFNAMAAGIRGAREELIRQERISTIGRLSTSLVHDLRNPLAAIYGGAEMLIDGNLPPSAVNRLARNIYNSSRRIQELLQDLTNVGRGRTDGAEMCRVSDVVRAACDMHADAAAAQAVSLEIDIPANLELPMERSRMERVFGNLVANALEAMPRGGKVRVGAHAEGGAVVVEVRDSGPGVPAEIAPRLFQPFVSAGKKNGLGLGLALSRQTVLDHGGDLWLASRAGESARFCVRLPLNRNSAVA